MTGKRNVGKTRGARRIRESNREMDVIAGNISRDIFDTKEEQRGLPRYYSEARAEPRERIIACDEAIR